MGISTSISSVEESGGAVYFHRQLFRIDFNVAGDGGEQLIAQDRDQIA